GSARLYLLSAASALFVSRIGCDRDLLAEVLPHERGSRLRGHGSYERGAIAPGQLRSLRSIEAVESAEARVHAVEPLVGVENDPRVVGIELRVRPVREDELIQLRLATKQLFAHHLARSVEL